eukprot:939939-Prymnesium_polylepis.1
MAQKPAPSGRRWERGPSVSHELAPGRGPDRCPPPPPPASNRSPNLGALLWLSESAGVTIR